MIRRLFCSGSRAVSETGFTLIEALVIMAVSSVGLLALLRFQGDINRMEMITAVQVEAHGLLQQQLEQTRIRYGTVSSGTKDDINASNTVFSLQWQRHDAFAGIYGLNQYSATIKWSDRLQKESVMTQKALIYADRALLPAERYCAAALVTEGSCSL
ncbi:type IV pilus modification PilV family protein [Oceanospirillum sediminis]|uniref:Prepilin-type N-terminal cleavage/methylation domain-containing protein n=1 Tax=Oceanospirillum sediminis TaxID=2760088 RepID=A0A839IU11_9GAMM|nr:prepilin-type N-terminal cleavage/methylation domain-containing protein [Oceanospirillum sediminis]MBB1487969.1 prepilin-type N-terminal cleavage/methylation domain-containing protein [Oceanospirillum sediminis]